MFPLMAFISLKGIAERNGKCEACDFVKYHLDDLKAEILSTDTSEINQGLSRKCLNFIVDIVLVFPTSRQKLSVYMSETPTACVIFFLLSRAINSSPVKLCGVFDRNMISAVKST